MSTQITEEVLDFDYHFHHLMNSPDQILKVMAHNKNKIDELKRWNEQLKEELEEHHKDGSIPNSVSGYGVVVSRRRNRQQWTYSDRVGQMQEDLRLQKETEEQEGIAIMKEATYSWTVHLARK